MVNFSFTKRETVVNFVTVSQFSLWTGGRAAEGTGLLNRRTGYTGTADPVSRMHRTNSKVENHNESKQMHRIRNSSCACF